MSEDIQLIHGDCLDMVPTLAARSVDTIVTDPPYFRMVDEPWDRAWKTADDYLAWMGIVVDQWRRVLKPNGSLYVFAAPRMAARVECLIAERFDVINAITWRKDAGCLTLKYGAENLRGYVEMSERIIFAEPSPVTTVDYLRGECEAAGLTPPALSGLLGFKETTGSIGPRRYLSVSGFAPISPPDYRRLQEKTGRFAKPYDDLYRPFLARADRPHTDVWDFAPAPRRPGGHPCEKPLPLIRHILDISTRPGDLILDPFAGSGTTPLACLKAGRRCVAIELDSRYIPVIHRRLKAAATPLFDLDGVAS